jgi:hypothetical protein
MMSAMSAEGARLATTSVEPPTVQLPDVERHSQVFNDPRSGDRVLRVTWHHDIDLVVLSLWREGTCVGTFRLERESVAPFVDSLLEGLSEPLPRLYDDHVGVVRTGAVDEQTRQAARVSPTEAAPAHVARSGDPAVAETCRSPSHRAPTTTPPAYATPDEHPYPPLTTPPAPAERHDSLADWIFASGDRDAG